MSVELLLRVADPERHPDDHPDTNQNRHRDTNDDRFADTKLDTNLNRDPACVLDGDGLWGERIMYRVFLREPHIDADEYGNRHQYRERDGDADGDPDSDADTNGDADMGCLADADSDAGGVYAVLHG